MVTILEKWIHAIKSKFKKRSTIVDILLLGFGTGCSIVPVGLFNQLPILVRNAPESWSLPSYLNMSLLLSNVSIFIYLFLKKICRGRLNDNHFMYSMIAISGLAIFLMGFCHDLVLEVMGEMHSVGLLVLCFVGAFYVSACPVVSLNYLNNFNGMYITSFFVGDGISFILSSVVSIGQGLNKQQDCNTTSKIDDELVFGTSEYIFFIFSTMCVCLMSFFLLNNLGVCKKQRVEFKDSDDESMSSDTKQWDFELCYLIFINFITSFCVYGFLPSLKSFSTLPYGYRAYRLTTILGDLANPLACSVVYFMSHITHSFVLINFIISILATVYVTLTAAQSPSPLLVDTEAGVILIILAWIIIGGIFNLTKLALVTRFRYKGDRWMIWCGGSIQVGSALGSIVAFLLINYFKLFEERDFCSPGNVIL